MADQSRPTIEHVRDLPDPYRTYKSYEPPANDEPDPFRTYIYDAEHLGRFLAHLPEGAPLVLTQATTEAFDLESYQRILGHATHAGRSVVVVLDR